jgi:hypothetical protein
MQGEWVYSSAILDFVVWMLSDAAEKRKIFTCRKPNSSQPA